MGHLHRFFLRWRGGPGRLPVVSQTALHVPIRAKAEKKPGPGVDGTAAVVHSASVKNPDETPSDHPPRGIIDAVATLHDISEARRFSEERYRLIAENTADIITLMDMSLNIVYVSPSVERALGFTPEEEWARPLPQSLTGESWRLAELAFAEEMALEESGGADPSRTRILELEHFRKDGSTVWLEVALSFVRDLGGRPTGVLAVSRDITERLRTERERQRLVDRVATSQRLEAVGRLAGGIAHDFNNLLTVIVSSLGFARDGLPADHPSAADVDNALRAARRAAGLVRQLLAFSGRQALEPRVIDLNELLSGLGEMLRRLLGESIEVEIRPAAAPCPVEADPGQIEQAIMNLAVNALDAMPGGGRLTIETAPADGDRVLLSVSDTGCGMDEETRRLAFEPFFTTKGPDKGTGLGLSIVYGIVGQCGGEIRVSSEPGTGATFEILLPRVGDPVFRHSTLRTPRRSTGTETVLVVEDEPAILAGTKRILEGFGYRVLAAAGGDEALEVGGGHEGPIDLLLTDVVMPGMNGRQLADRLALHRPDLKVLYMSGYTDNAIAHHGVLEPGTHLIEKPFEAEQLARRVREVLDAP